MLKLANVVYFIVQFNSANSATVPEEMKKREREFEPSKHGKKVNGKSRPFATGFERCSLEGLDSMLMADGLVLVDGYYQRISNLGDKLGKAYFHRVTFVFASPMTDELLDSYLEKGGNLEEPFRQLTGESFWTMKGYLNPYFRNGEAFSGLSAVSICLGAREPRVDGNGNAITRWQKVDGKKVGACPVPVWPKHRIAVREGELRLTFCE
jgi:hypothetical protein